MKRETYERGLSEYLEATRCNEVENNMIDKLQSRVKRFASTKLATRLNMKNIIMDAPNAPKLFAFAKTHKEGQQLCPVVDKVKAPTRKLEEEVHNILTPHVEGYQFSITNTVDLIEQFRVITSPSCITVLDFRSLYPSIEIPPCFCALRDFLFKKVDTNELHHQVLELADLICYNSVFQFRGVMYSQTRGVPMGSSVSGDLCELVIRQLENRTLPNFLQDIILYKRYVDDIIILWRTTPNLTRFLEEMNENPYGLSLEIEQHSNSRIHFRNLDISFEDSIIRTSVYRKLSNLSAYIPFNS
ncbi:telomerase reverse transcriptase-like [Centruroides sculpturatus]|uniref:telomerase reverse transcriptase-like n=1 Tax=Centruroides sculpturatus TaxID=218467 RepID=UPI000C6CB3DC|nr:telomerase reverse transcriptase-like [Centruroides sculpturatus]